MYIIFSSWNVCVCTFFKTRSLKNNLRATDETIGENNITGAIEFFYLKLISVRSPPDVFFFCKRASTTFLFI